MRRPGRLRADPERSFEELYRHHAPQVYRYALALLDSTADAEEVTQTTFLNAYRAIQGGERPRAPAAWLRTIALNLCRQRFRQAARRPSEVPLDDDVADVVADEAAPTLEDLTRALRHLPFSQRAALVMREFEGLSPREIAKALELSTSAVEALLFRARRSLREQLEGSLTCEEAERDLSLQLDRQLPRAERGRLRAHLRECSECARLARGMRAQRGAMKSLALLPLPSSLAWASQSGAGAAIGASVTGGAPIVGSLSAKLVAGALATTVLVGGGYEAVVDNPGRAARTDHDRTTERTASAPARSQRVLVAAPARPLLGTGGPHRAPTPHGAGGHTRAKARGGGREAVSGLLPVAAVARPLAPAKTAPARPAAKPKHRTSKARMSPKAKPPKSRAPKKTSPSETKPAKTKTRTTPSRPAKPTPTELESLNPDKAAALTPKLSR